MTIPVQNTYISNNNMEFLVNRLNELANYMSTCVPTTSANDSSTEVAGSCNIAGSLYLGSSISVGNSVSNTAANSSHILIRNSSVVLDIVAPNTYQTTVPHYFDANSSWVPMGSQTKTYSFTGNTIQVVDSWTKSFIAADYFIYKKANDSNEAQTSKLMVLMDIPGNTSQITEYASLSSNGTLGAFSVSPNATHVVLTFTPISALTNTTIKMVRNLY